MYLKYPLKQGLYDPREERDACGVGFVTDMTGTRSHKILEMGVESVCNVTHRGAIGADAKTGDGAGVLTQIPLKLFKREIQKLGHRVTRPGDFAVGMIFFPHADRGKTDKARDIIESVIQKHTLPLFGWRVVPVDASILGDEARESMPHMEQILVGHPAHLREDAFERELYLVRKEIERELTENSIDDCYIPSFSAHTVVYKGLLVAPQLARFYKDLIDPEFETAIALFHQRYSTNTFPNWILAQPFRMLAHNGEINTLQGNQNWMRAREREMTSAIWKEKVKDLAPVIQEGGSDSAIIDNVLELLVHSGRDIRSAMMMMIPEAWENLTDMDPELRAFYEYHSCITEPWDGPAAVGFTDGVVVGAILDRNGLRPARYTLTERGLLVMGSEAGVVSIDDRDVAEKGRLGPGQTIAVDTRKKKLFKNDDVKKMFSHRKSYGRWLKRKFYRFEGHTKPMKDTGWISDFMTLRRWQRYFGYSDEEMRLVIAPMVATRKEPVFSMGDDTPPSIFAKKPRLLYTYFKQKFAQVTNPPIDSLRERMVMSLGMNLGKRGSLLEQGERHAKLLHLSAPVLLNHEFEELKGLTDRAFASTTLSTLYPVNGNKGGGQALEGAVRELCEAAERSVENGKTILILSDRGIDAANASIPILLAVSAVHQHLIRVGKRMQASIVVESGEVWEHHQFAMLYGYGASAVNPYLAFETIRDMYKDKKISEKELKDVPIEQALRNYRAAVDNGLLKIASKMGISTLGGYQGAQIFEAVGLSEEFIASYFPGTPSKVSGVGIEEIAEAVRRRHAIAFGHDIEDQLKDEGNYRFRRDGEYHAFNPNVIKAIHKLIKSGEWQDYKAYANLVGDREPMAIRDLLKFKPAGSAIPIKEVEPIEKIIARFCTQAMSLGALSPEAHSTIAIAMNRIGGKSNTGEGGEDPDWWKPFENGDTASSKIKQIASGRFGVTPEYMSYAEELEIKMAQGSKPGEGGQLPAHKVYPHIARLRHTIPSIPLISPPPHHDIYSIEDLAQLIYDLKVANANATVCVKLVSEAGVGTIAAGVAKGYADTILISGCEGGTGASPLSSIKNAGVPWEMGLSETQQVLVLNNLRSRVKLRTDGGMKTARDVVVAAMLGAEEYGFGTAALVAVGCVMARQCHLNTCPVGVATQDEKLRAKFTGTPEAVVHLMTHLAGEVREILAGLGVREMDEIIGHPEFLEIIDIPEGTPAKKLALDRILHVPDPEGNRPRRKLLARNDRPDKPFDEEKLLPKIRPHIASGEPIRLDLPIHNTDRTIGARVSGEIAKKYGDKGLPSGTVDITLRGTAGQSFGAFGINGLRLTLFGEANDYVGKCLGGGEIIIRPNEKARFPSHLNVIAGNTILYGATGGKLFVAGRVGERFAVRNSGAIAVVEGVGDHGCEYMTSGLVVVLGEVGRNFGAGMSHGLAFVLDENGIFPFRYNKEMIRIERLERTRDINALKDLIQEHATFTGSMRARVILNDWDKYQPLFWKVIPLPAEKVLQATEVTEEAPEEKPIWEQLAVGPKEKE